jgi:Protein of unknown function, DUF481
LRSVYPLKRLEPFSDSEIFVLRMKKIVLTAVLSLAAISAVAIAQTPAPAKPAPPAPDVMIFTNGDQLTGHVVSAAGGNLNFQSDMAGTLAIPFAKIKELRTGEKPAQFAVLKKGLVVKKNMPAPEGTLRIAGGDILVARGEAASNQDATSEAIAIPAADVNVIVPRAEFDKEVSGHHSFIEGWNGVVTGGATLVRSTTSASTFTAAVNMVRAMPTVGWLPPSNRTAINITETYGKNTSPGAIPQTTPPTLNVVTLSSIFHADAERDQYFSPRFYVLGDAGFDHNYAQGLSLQQVYGGGIGWTPIKSPKQQLDLKVDLHYETQTYLNTSINGAPAVVTPSTQLIGSTISEAYHRNLPHKILFTETANILPAFNTPNDYSYNVSGIIALPVYKRLSASFSTTDNYLNDPATGYKKNSYQFVTGVTYTLH